MGSIGSKAISSASSSYSYDIEDYATQRGYDSAEAMIETNLTESGNFWTRDSDMVDFVEDLDYTVTSSPNGESFTIIDDRDNSDAEFIVYYEKGGNSRYITRVRKV